MSNVMVARGLVTVEKSEDGRWMWISDTEGECWAELDCKLRLSIVPSALRGAVTAAYFWATVENENLRIRKERMNL